MWVLIANGPCLRHPGLATGRFRRSFCRSGRAKLHATLLPHSPGGVADLARYNAVQKVIYLGILLVGIVIVASGLAIWKPVQFALPQIFWAAMTRRGSVHFFAMAAIVLFLVLHIVMAVLVPKSLRAMILGR